MRSGVIIFAKDFQTSDVKTRLAATTSTDFAINFYKNSLIDTVNSVKDSGFPYFIFSYPDIFSFKAEDGSAIIKSAYKQAGYDLGEKMFNAFDLIFQHNFDCAIIIGSDTPQINGKIVTESLNSLSVYDTVLGPASDGGYYLIGFRRGALILDIFKNIEWSTPEVFKHTVKKIDENGLSTNFVEELRDIDTIEDLRNFYQIYNSSDLLSINFIKQYQQYFNL